MTLDRIQGRIVCFLFWLITAAFIALAGHRIHTLVTGQDPRTFLALARTIAEQNFSFSSILQAASFAAPGYPLFLAAIIKTTGLQSAFIVNAVLFFVLLFFLARFWKDQHSHVETVIFILFMMWRLFAGHEHNAHFLLQPFRNTPAYLFMMTAIMMSTRSSTRQSAQKSNLYAISAALILITGSLFRETVILLVPVLALWFFMYPSRVTHRRNAQLFFFVAPFLFCLLALLLFALFTGSLLNSQSQQVLHIFSNLPMAADTLRIMGRMVGFLVDELGVPGLLLLAIGLLRLRKETRLFILFFLPAVLFFLFYGIIKPHRRFFLTIYFLLLPIAATGLCYLLSRCSTMLERIKKPLSASLYGAIICLLLFLNIDTIQGLQVWGEHVTQSQISEMKQSLEAHAPVDAKLLVDPRTRYLIDALTVFTDYEPANPIDLGPGIIQDPPLLFIEPMNDVAIHPENRFANGKQTIEQYASIYPTSEEFYLGRGHYRITLVKPWTNLITKTHLSKPSAQPAALRYELPELYKAFPERTRLHCVLNGHIIDTQPHPGINYRAIHKDINSTGYIFQIVSDAPLPPEVRATWQPLNKPLVMNFGAAVAPSYKHYLSDDFFVHDAVNIHAREVGDTGTVTIPVVYPSNNYLVVMLGASSVHRERDVFIHADFLDGANLLATVPYRSDSRLHPVIAHLGNVSPPLTNLTLRFSKSRPYQHPPVDDRGWNQEIHNLTIFPISPKPAQNIKIGSREAIPFTQEGFYDSESNGRWTMPESTFWLPLPPKENGYRVIIQTHPYRHPEAPAANPVFTFNGSRLETTYAEDGTSISAIIPSTLISSFSNQLKLTVAPWRPCDLLDSRDDRPLGVFVNNVSWKPIE